jgi:PPK2 family polyphosphate:nucleotide phosphotransferase
MIDSPYLVRPGKKLKLSDLDTGETGKFKDKDQARPVIAKNIERLQELQELLYAQSKHALLIVFQAMDTGGKDGAISHVFSGVNPQGCQVSSFKVPTKLELAHDFLWRIHAATPAKGMIGIFNRSHYESVLVERVHDLVPEKVWSKRYERINEFERLLSDEGTTILKFFLHISKGEQKRRLQARLKDKNRHWKLDPNDFHERKLWGKYMSAYQDALRNCSTERAPWYVVPSDHKWFRNWVLSDTIVRTVEKLGLKYPPTPPGVKGLKLD